MKPDDIMTIEEVARYLRVSDRTVYDWAQKGTIPGGKLGSSWRFKRSEIKEWVDERLGDDRKKTRGAGWVALSDLLSPERVILMENPDKTAALNILIERLVRLPGIVDRSELSVAIFRREEMMSTGIGSGIGVPHVRLASIPDIAVAIGICPAGVRNYQSLDGDPVNIITMIVSGADQQELYLKTLAAICSRLREPLLREKIMSASDPGIVCRLLAGEPGIAS